MTHPATASDAAALGDGLIRIARALRGSAAAGDARAAMLPIAFLRGLSANYERAVARELGWPPDRRFRLADALADHPGGQDGLSRRMRAKVGYALPPQHLWGAVARSAEAGGGVRFALRLSEAIRASEAGSTLGHLVGTLTAPIPRIRQLRSTPAEIGDALRDAVLATDRLVGRLPDGAGPLADAFERLVGHFAAQCYHSDGGDAYTPRPVADLLAGIVAWDTDRAGGGPRARLNAALDFACGSGSLLLNVRRQVGPMRIGRLHGHDRSHLALWQARMSMALNGLPPQAFELRLLDALTELGHEPTLHGGFDAVVAAPSFSVPIDRAAMAPWARFDARFRGFDLPGHSDDFAFLLHGLHHLAPGGTMAMAALHPGFLGVGGWTGAVRRVLVERGLVDAVIQLPPGLFPSSGAPSAVLVLKRRPVPRPDVLLIDASALFEPAGRRLNRLTDVHVARILETHRRRPEALGRFARRVGAAEIAAQGHSLAMAAHLGAPGAPRAAAAVRSPGP